jgi:hypothetical protein
MSERELKHMLIGMLVVVALGAILALWALGAWVHQTPAERLEAERQAAFWGSPIVRVCPDGTLLRWFEGRLYVGRLRAADGLTPFDLCPSVVVQS